VEDDELICVCEHLQRVHQSAIPEAQLPPICFHCYDVDDGYDPTHDFKLGNLKYIEQLAKERKLI
jgi:hypothetical protein